MAVSGTDVTVQVPEGCTIPTTGGVSAVAYSTQANPYGFVSDKGRWILYSTMSKNGDTNITTSFAAGTSYKLPVYAATYIISCEFQISHAGGAAGRDYYYSIRVGGTSLASGLWSAVANSYSIKQTVNTIYTTTGGDTLDFGVYRGTDNGGVYQSGSRYTITQLTDFGL